MVRHGPAQSGQTQPGGAGNPKPEFRNPKQIRNAKPEGSKIVSRGVFVSNFELRISSLLFFAACDQFGLLQGRTYAKASLRSAERTPLRTSAKTSASLGVEIRGIEN